MFKYIVILGLILLLFTGCSASVAENQPTETAVSTEPAKAAATPRPTSQKSPPGLIIVNYEDSIGLAGRIIDPETLADLPAYTPLDLGHHNPYALSPDGRTLAMISRPEDYNNNDVLRLIDLPTWQVFTTTMTFDDHVFTLEFGADSRTLYWTEPTVSDPANGIPGEFVMRRYDVAQDEVTAVIPFPSSFVPQEMRLLNSGQIAVYGTTNQTPVAVDAIPHLLILDPTAETIVADTPLENVIAGQYRLQNSVNKLPYRLAQPGLAWDTAQNLLYIVHAEEDKVTVVDLTNAEIAQQVNIAPQQSILERVLSWGVQTAHAKVVPGVAKQAVLSPDGQHLFVIGLTSEIAQVEDGSMGWIWHETPMGLQVIDTETLTEKFLLDLPVTNMALSPDGRWLLLTSAYDETRTVEGVERVQNGLYIVDTENMDVTHHLLANDEVYLQGFAANGRFAYVSTATGEWLEDHYGNWQTQLHVVDLAAGQLIAEREFAGSYLKLIP